jgi:DNA-binding transcriptional ArsR family regulator
MATHESQLLPVFGALADPTRFAVVQSLMTGPASVSDLAAPFAMAGPSFLKHLRVLESAGLIITLKAGRVRTVRLEPKKLTSIADWFAQHRQEWEARFDRLGDVISKDNPK